MFKKLITKIYKRKLLVRYDPDGTKLYFSPSDFELSGEPFAFSGDKGQRLQGYFYRRGDVSQNRMIVFDHGMGCGHKAYIAEISEICSRGYEVFTYDHTGTLESGGEHIGGFTQSLVDLDVAISAIKQAGKTAGRKITVIGHSWGGYAAMNIPAYHRDIDSIVALSGFISASEMLKTVLGKMQKHLPHLLSLEEESFGKYAHADARNSLRLAEDTRALIIHSRDDSVCPFSHFENLRDAVGEGKNVSFLAVDKKNHNPNYTCDAVACCGEMFQELTRLKKQKRLNCDEEKAAFITRWDWRRITAQDTALWEQIFQFIEK